MDILNKVIDLPEVLSGEMDEYDKFIQDMISWVEENFEQRGKLIKVKLANGKKRKMPLVHFITTVNFLRPFIQFGYELDNDFILSEDQLNNMSVKVMSKYYNKIIYTFIDQVPNSEICDCIASMQEIAADISRRFNVFFGNSVSIHSLIELADKDPEMDKIIHTTLPENKSIAEQEKYLKDQTNKCVDILKKEDNCFKDYLNCGEGVNILQLTQYMINIGFKPDLDGNTQPIPVNTNYLLGLRNAADYYIDASGGRKAAITNSKQTKKSGYLMRKLSLLCSNTTFNRNKDGETIMKDCGSKNYLEIEVLNQDILNLLDHKYYLNPKTKKLDLIIADEDSDLIGKTVKLRSSVTCKCKNGICQTCYGRLNKINHDIHIGILAVLELTSRLTQKMLSSKHLLTTKSESIDWGENFLKYFFIDTNAILFNPDYIDSDLYLVIDNKSILEDDELIADLMSGSDDDDSSEINDGQLSTLKQNINSFKLEKKNRRGENKIKEITVPKNLYFSEYLQDLISQYKLDDENSAIEIPLKQIMHTEPLFYFIIENNELSKVLQDIILLIDNNEHLGQNTIKDMSNKFLSLLVESGINVNFAHIELIIRNLIRDPNNILERPENIGDSDFSDDDYKILKVTEAIMKSEALGVSLSFEHFKKQITSPDTFKKTGDSVFDYLL